MINREASSDLAIDRTWKMAGWVLIPYDKQYLVDEICKYRCLRYIIHIGEYCGILGVRSAEQQNVVSKTYGFVPIVVILW